MMASSVGYTQSDIYREIEERIENLKRPRTENISKNVEFKASASFLKEQNLLAEILKGYDHLKQYAVSYRYEYMHKALQAASSNPEVRHQKLTTWLEMVNREIMSRQLHEKFNNRWKVLYTDIKVAINEVNSVVENVKFSESVVINNDNEVEFLDGIKRRLSLNTEVVPTTEATTTAELSDVSIIYDNKLLISIAASALTITFAFAALFSRRKKQNVSTPKAQSKSFRIETPLLANVTVEEKRFEECKLTATEVSNLESSYLNCLKRNDHLLKQAEIKVLNGIKSPFNSVISVPQERLDQALNFLLQGTLAVANTSSKKATHLEWNCIAQEGRYSLNLTLHGVSCDERSLILNTIIDADFSGPAYFGRAEQTLEEHQPTILFKSNQQKTTISLSLDDSVTSRLQSH